ncbi:YdeI/OmpD-associated family protein [Cyclobacterium xiamenense]|uniref:YdeI/OmpD-associated family protein n=1 Tax=Cyclobacterium xiamenense TaxID=1297121 RepID=UPI0012B6ED3E|nr:YdeI/OmpD-associated family protein [Cyclobacterium xiamenense]
MTKTENFEKVEVSSAEELRSWLLQHHRQQESIWLVTWKKSDPQRYVSREEVLDELLCFGWIDGIRRKLDEERTMQLIAKRKAEHWAATYKERAARLIAAGNMHESGLKAIERATANGLWDFMEDVDQLMVPKDLSDALATYSGATAFFNGINPSSKRFVLRWLKLARTEKTRQKRIEQLTQLAARSEKLPGS